MRMGCFTDDLSSQSYSIILKKTNLTLEKQMSTNNLKDITIQNKH